MKKRSLAVVLAAAMLALLATGCSANGTADNSKGRRCGYWRLGSADG